MKKSSLPSRRLVLLVMPLILMNTLMIGCATKTHQPDIDAQHQEALTESEQIIQAAEKLTSPVKEQKLLTAIPLLLDEGKVVEAEKLLTKIHIANLPDSVIAEAGIATAEVAKAKGNAQQVIEMLVTPRYGIPQHISRLPLTTQNKVSLMRAEAYEQLGDRLAAAHERIFVAPMLPRELLPENNEYIWQDLASFPRKTLEELVLTTNTPDTRAWLELVIAFKQYSTDTEQQLNAIQIWSRQHVAHPANQAMPKALALLKTLSTSHPRKIALLLPKSGPFKPAAEAIEQGFMTSYFLRQEAIVDKSTPSVKLYDEGAGENFDAVYNQALEDGASMVIGPLNKDNVRRLYRRQVLPVPTIALNSSDLANSAPTNLFQFGLSPEDDARSVAIYAANAGHINAGILVHDNGEWSQRVQRAFMQQWEAMGNPLIATATYKNQVEMEAAIKSLLELKESQVFEKEISQIAEEELSAATSPRPSLDFVFLVTPGEQQARQVKPLFQFHNAGALPLLGGSYLYSGIMNVAVSPEMNGIQFCDIPWILDSSPDIKLAFERAWPDADPRMVRFNALGVDAFKLANRVQAMQEIPESKLYGATGVIHLDSQGRLVRALSWGQFRDGHAIPALALPDSSGDSESVDPSGI